MSEPWRIFIIGNEEALTRNIVSSLRLDGYVAAGATSGADAIRILWVEEYDMVVCDLKTPGINGLELLQWLRSYRPSTRIIIVDARNEGERAMTRTQALESGAASYLGKPLSLHSLKEELHALLQQTGFSANLDSFDLLDVTQIVSMSSKSIALLVSTGLEERGVLCFLHGELVWAEYGILRGEEAFFALAAHKNGTVIQQPWSEQVTPNVTQPLARLILQALQYRTKYAAPPVGAEPPARGFVPEDDDSPFLVLTEQEVSSAPSLPAIQTLQVPQTPRPSFNAVNTLSMQPSEHEQNGSEREWWEQTDTFAPTHTTVDKSRSTPGEVPATPFRNAFPGRSPTLKRGSAGGQKRPAREEGGLADTPGLPSWLMDQPLVAGTPVLYPPEQSGTRSTPVLPLLPAQPVTPLPSAWQPPSVSTEETVQLGQETTREFQKPVSPNTSSRTNSLPTWPADRIDEPVAPALPHKVREVREALSLRRHQRMVSESAWQARQVGQYAAMQNNYNYQALVSALQTLGYSIPGFVAAAVVSLDGQPIAHIAVEALDIVQMCKNFSMIMRSILQSLDTDVWGDYQNTLITSGEHAILLGLVGSQKDAFQILVTARKTDLTECNVILAKVEAAITTALHV